MAVKSLKLYHIDLASQFSPDSLHDADGSIDLRAGVPRLVGRTGAPDAAAVAVSTHRNDGYASNVLSGDVWQQTPAVTDDMESGGND